MMNISHYYIVSFCWGIFVFFSFLGWGCLLQKVFLPSERIDWGERSAWGVGLSILIGGILNLFGAISGMTVIFYVCMGVFYFFILNSIDIKKFFLNISNNSICLWREDRAAVFVIFIVFFLLLLRYAAWVSVPGFKSDDAHGYLAFSQKMLDTGSLGIEPFSERRINALGGHSFLQVLIFSVTQLRSLYIIDSGLAFIIAAGILWSFARKKNISRLSASLAICFILLLTSKGNVNSSSMGMAFALFMALFYIFDEFENNPKAHRFGYLMLSALIISALAASKSVFAGFAAVYVVIVYIGRLFRFPSKVNILSDFFILTAAAFLFLLPWMIASYQSSGTLFYPFLGKGFHRAAYGYVDFVPLTLERFFKVIIFGPFKALIAAPLILFVLCMINRKKENVFTCVCICLTAIICITVVSLFFSGGVCLSAYRYIFPLLFSCVAIVGLYIFSFEFNKKNENPVSKYYYIIIIILLLPALFLAVFSSKDIPDFGGVFQNYFVNIERGIRQKYRLSLEYARRMNVYRKAQYSLPPGEVILSRLYCPFLLDFKRNRIFIVDQLISGPPPGIPVFGSSEAVAEYLVSHGINYCLYAYAGAENSIETNSLLIIAHDSWIRQQRLFTYMLHLRLNELGKSRKRVYDDGSIFVIDLRKKP